MDVAIIQGRSKRKQRRKIIRKIIVCFPYDLSNTNRFLTNIENHDFKTFMLTAITHNNEKFDKDVALRRSNPNFSQHPHNGTNNVKSEKKIVVFENGRKYVDNQPPHRNIYVNDKQMNFDVIYVVEGSTCLLIVEKSNAKDYFKVRFKSKQHDVASKSLRSLPFHSRNSLQTINSAVKKFFIVSIICNLFSSYLRCYVPCVPHSSWSFRNLRHGFLITWLLKLTYLYPLIIFCNNILIVIVAPCKRFDYEFALSLFVTTEVSAKLFPNIEWHLNLPIIIKNSKIKAKISDNIVGPINNLNNKYKARTKQKVLKTSHSKDILPTVSKKNYQFDANHSIDDENIGFHQRRLFVDSAPTEDIKYETLNESCLSRICNEILEYKTVVTRIFQSPYLDDKRIFNSVKKCKETVKEMITCPEFYKSFLKQLGKTFAYTLFSSVNVNF